MRYTVILITVLMFMLSVFSTAGAWRYKKPVTPYGDHCPRCSDYGICRSPMGHDDARGAMLDYYHKKGLHVEIMNKKGRFIKAKIKDANGVVDVIIFDRHTGRVRSIY